MIDETAIERGAASRRRARGRASAPRPRGGGGDRRAARRRLCDARLPVGTLLLARTDRGLVRLAYVDFEGEDEVVAELASRISPRVLAAPRRLDEVRRELDQYFTGARHEFEVPIDWRLTHGFGRRVLRATARIPYGGVSSYKQVAAAAGSPRGSRAAGNALGSNPIPIVVPCHRVLHSGGGLGGYTGGVERKQLLLAVERGVPAAPE